MERLAAERDERLGALMSSLSWLEDRMGRLDGACGVHGAGPLCSAVIADMGGEVAQLRARLLRYERMWDEALAEARKERAG